MYQITTQSSSHKAGHMPKKAPLKQDFISAPMEKIACDIVGPLPENTTITY